MDQVRRLDERAHQSIVYYEEDDWLQDRSEPGPEKELVIRDTVDPGVVADDGDLEEGGHIEGAHLARLVLLGKLSLYPPRLVHVEVSTCAAKLSEAAQTSFICNAPNLVWRL